MTTEAKIITPADSIVKTGSFKGRYFGEEFIKTEFQGSAPIVNGWLWERDTILLLGKEKSCKSLLAQALSLHITAGHDFLGEFKIDEPCNVIYLQAEGKIAQTQQNLKRMMKVYPADMRRFLMLYYPAIALNTPQGFEEVYKQIKSWEPLKARNTVFVGDCLYMMMSGTLKDDDIAKDMVSNLRTLGDEFGLTYLVLAHSHREKLDAENGFKSVFEGDNAIFGSFVWKAFPDHILMVQKHDHKLKVTCNTQRTGEVMEETSLILNEPDPLFFSVPEFGKPSDDMVFNTLKLAGKATVKELMIKTGLAKATICNALNRLLIAEKVIRTHEFKEFIWHVKP